MAPRRKLPPAYILSKLIRRVWELCMRISGRVCSDDTHWYPFQYRGVTDDTQFDIETDQI